MFEKTKIVKAEDGRELEVYTDSCSKCGQEMIAVKFEIDAIKFMSPIVYKKICSVDYCVNCYEKILEKNPETKIFSEQDLEEMKDFINPEDAKKFLS